MKRIVVGFDGSNEASDALVFACRLARHEDAKLVIVTAGLFEPQLSTKAERDAAMRSRRGIYLKVEEMIGERPFEPRVVDGLPAARGLVGVAEDERADLIAIGSTHRGAIGRVFPGSLGAQLLHGSPCPVAVIPRGFRKRAAEVHGVIGIAYDGGRESVLALAEAERLTWSLEGRLRVITVAARGEGSWAETLDRGLAQVSSAIGAEARLLEGDPAAALVSACDELDLLVMGSRGRGPLARTILGSVSVHLCCRAPCPVVIVPRAAQPEPRPQGEAALRALVE